MKTWYIRILPRPEVLDVQGRTVLQMLQNHDLPFTKVRVGKMIELTMEKETGDSSEVLKKALSLGLYNPLIEVAEIEKNS
jgi:phosphoribosylformylglycinamidine (FGAM) synthase PurS component